MDDDELAEASAAFGRWTENNPHGGDALHAWLAAWDASQHEAPPRPGVRSEPFDRATRLCNAATWAIEQHPEGGPEIRLVIMLSGDGLGGLVTSGYRDSKDSIPDLLFHTKKLFNAHGMDFEIAHRRDVPRPLRPARLPAGLSRLAPATDGLPWSR